MGKKRKVPLRAESASQRHEHTNTAPTGLGQQLSAAPGRLAKGPLKDLSSTQPAAKWAPPAVAPSASASSPAAAVELEVARAAALDHLRHKLASCCAKAGLRNVPLLAFERWRFAAKWAEDEPQRAAAAAAEGAAAGPGKPSSDSAQQAASKSSKASGKRGPDPVLPYGSAPAAAEPGLVQDLVRAGLEVPVAAAVALQLAEAAAEAAAGLAKKRHQLASGKAPSCAQVTVAFHRHSLDLTCGSAAFVKVSRAAYGKLARLYRQHTLSRAGPAAQGASSLGLPLEEAVAAAAKLEAQAAAAGVAGAGAAEGDGTRPSKRQRSSSSSSRGGAGDGEPSEESGGEEELGSDSDGDGAGVGAAAGRGGGVEPICAEARIAQMEAALARGQQQQQQQEQQGAGASSSSSGGDRTPFHQRLFALLLRYKSIQGHGFQAAAGPPVFELLRQKMGVGFEAFASPMNSHFQRYGSAFPDVDGPFGSAGSFFRMHLKHGSYEANPPFVPAMLTATAQHILQLLAAAEAAGGALSFVVLMPGWQEVGGWQALRSSPFLTASLLVAAADHGYCDGASHQRRDLYRQSPFDSGVLFLQTKAGAAKWRVGQELLDSLAAAMASCCPSAAAAERQRMKRGLADLELRGLGLPVQKVGPTAAQLLDGRPGQQQEQEQEGQQGQGRPKQQQQQQGQTKKKGKAKKKKQQQGVQNAKA